MGMSSPPSICNRMLDDQLGKGSTHAAMIPATAPSSYKRGSLPAEHGSELLRHALEHLLHCRGVADEGGTHLEPHWRDVADAASTPQRQSQHMTVWCCLRASGSSGWVKAASAEIL